MGYPMNDLLKVSEETPVGIIAGEKELIKILRREQILDKLIN
jgi:hypothetical protein